MDVLTRLQAMGIALRAEGDRLHAAPKAALTEEARAMIRDHKPELLAGLSAKVYCAACCNVRMSEVKIPGVGGRFMWGCARGHMEHGYTTPDLHQLTAPQACLSASDYNPIPSAIRKEQPK